MNILIMRKYSRGTVTRKRFNVWPSPHWASKIDGYDTARQFVDLGNEDRDRISGLGRAAASALRMHRALMGRPITASNWLVKKTGITPATVNKSLEHLERLGIVRELTSRKRTRSMGGGEPFSDRLKIICKRKAKMIWGTRRREFKIDHVVDICEGTLAYDGALVVGAVCEFIETLDQEGTGGYRRG